MKLNEAWLRESIGSSMTNSEIASKLTMAGLEVDSFVAMDLEFNKVVIAEILEVRDHPINSSMHVCKLNLGSELVEVVSKADNLYPGMFCVLAKPGACLAKKEIAAEKLGGVLSYGMLCSYADLGISKTSLGVIDLQPTNQSNKTLLGLDFAEYFNDNILEVDLTPNRGDCNSLHGILRELACLAKKQPKFNLAYLAGPKIEINTKDKLQIKLNDSKACPLYIGRVIKNLAVTTPTPFWMVQRLFLAGQQSINIVVDILNYVMLELGQPMHAFDLTKIQGDISVRWAKANEKLTLLNDDKVSLDEDTLVVADEKMAHAMAGVMGGKESSVTFDTTDIFLESAYFAQSRLSGTALRYGLRTESSYRFERGVDPNLVEQAINRATELLLSLCQPKQGTISVGELSKAGEAPLNSQEIHLPKELIKQVLGIEIDDAEVIEILSAIGAELRLDVKIESKPTGSSFIVHTPSHRHDLVIAEDLIEEIIRIKGFSSIPMLPFTLPLLKQNNQQELPLERMKRYLVDNGYHEAITYSFVSTLQEKLSDKQALELLNPISQEMAVMRTQLWQGLLGALRYNVARQQQNLKLFEVGLSFVAEQNIEHVVANVKQDNILAGACLGKAVQDSWLEADRVMDFYTLKGELEAMLSMLDVSSAFKFVVGNNKMLHPGRCADIMYAGELVGSIGELDPRLKNLVDLEGSVYLFELNLTKIAACKQIKAFNLKPVCKFPAIRRDLALVVEQNLVAGEIVEYITSIAGELLRSVQVFDVYSGKGIEKNHKSIGLGLILQDDSSTLTDEVIEEFMTNLSSKLETKFNAKLRE